MFTLHFTVPTNKLISIVKHGKQRQMQIASVIYNVTFVNGMFKAVHTFQNVKQLFKAENALKKLEIKYFVSHTK